MSRNSNHSCRRCEVFSDEEFKRFAYMVGVRGQLTKKQVCERVAELVEMENVASLENSDGSREESIEMSEEEKQDKEDLRHFVEHYWKQDGKK